MTECKDGHEWRLNTYHHDFECPFCDARLTNKQAEAMLNAAEKLTTEDARLLHEMWKLHIAMNHAIYDRAITSLTFYAKARSE